MKIKVMSREKIEHYQCNENHIVISISNPKQSDAELPKNDFRLDTLKMNFYDTDYLNKTLDNAKEYTFNDDMAKQILQFVDKYISQYNINCIFVNCVMGISRSAAVGAALSYIYNQDDSFYFKNFCPNRFIYRIILNEYFE